MTGTWLAAAARRLLREETFRLTAAPAIADLQFDRISSGPVGLTRGYRGVCSALIGALLHDLRLDAGVAFGRGASPIWTRAALGFTGLVVLLTAVPMAGRDVGSMRPAAQLVTVAWYVIPAAFGAMAIVMAGVSFAIGRTRPGEGRSIVLAAIVIGTSMSMAAIAARPIRDELRARRDAAIWQMWGGPEYQGLSLGEVARRLEDPVSRQADPRLRPVAPPPRTALHWSNELFAGTTTVWFSLVGLSLSRAYGWRLLRRMLSMILAWTILTIVSAAVMLPFHIPGMMPELLLLRYVLMILTFGVIFVAIPESRRPEQPAAASH